MHNLPEHAMAIQQLLDATQNSNIGYKSLANSTSKGCPYDHPRRKYLPNTAVAAAYIMEQRILGAAPEICTKSSEFIGKRSISGRDVYSFARE